MAAYFIKYKYYRGYAEGYGHDNDIIDFDKFEKVNKESIYEKLRKAAGVNGVKIEDIVKL